MGFEKLIIPIRNIYNNDSFNRTFVKDSLNGITCNELLLTRSERYIYHNNNRFTIYEMCGISGSGKSTFVNNNYLDLPVISRDTIRTKLGFCENGKKVIGTSEQEDLVTQIENDLIMEYCRNCNSFVLDNMFIKKKYRIGLYESVKKYKPFIVIVYMNTPVDVCINRRKNDLDKNIILEMNNRLEVPTQDECDILLTINN